LYNSLKDKNLYDNTIIVYVADHGEYLGDHGRFQKGMPGMDVITNVPCIIKLPKGMGHINMTDTLIEEVDLMPTLLELVGAEVPYEVQGESFTEIIRGAKSHHKRSVICEMFNPGLIDRPPTDDTSIKPEEYGTMVRTQDYKYYIGNQFKSEEFLYDMIKDPSELKNVAYDETYLEIKNNMRFELIKKLQIASYSHRKRKEMMW